MKITSENIKMMNRRERSASASANYKWRHRRVPLLMVTIIIVIELSLLTNVAHCLQSFVIYWNTTNPIFRIDNNDHVIDVNKGNLNFEYDQVHIICPLYDSSANENETEKYIIYNVSKVEYETCRITNPNPRIIAICDKPYSVNLVTISFRPFTPQPGGLEFKPGKDYYFISTSSRDDIHRRIGGRCQSHHTKVIFKVFGGDTEAQKTTTTSTTTSTTPQPHTRSPPRIDWESPVNSWRNHHNDEPYGDHRTNSDNTQYSNRINHAHQSTQRPVFVNNAYGNVGTSGSGFTVNKPTKKTNDYDTRQNEVIKTEELTYNNNSSASYLGSHFIILCSLIVGALLRLLKFEA
ncbi:ephrin-B1-like [Chironomus tepperi]|uniref:ephrin-B1-like n=1 Tax=Chironomus tepperi TaxID=113505 RepID=UPI00391F375D